MNYRATILIVEDDINLLQGIRDILELQGYAVLTASHGLEGLELMRHSEAVPDLIISDIMMPQMDGYEFFKEIRNDERWMGIPFLFLTAKGEKNDVRTGKLLGAEDYLIKSLIDAEDLVVAVASKLRRSKEIEQIHTSHVSAIKRNILTILNHEFRTPLTYIVAYADMLNRDADELKLEEMKSFLRGINAGADRLRRLIENFILLVELETGEAQETFNWRRRQFNDFGPILAVASEQLQANAEENQVQIQVKATKQPLPPILGDIEYLKVAIIRLLDNAIKFSDKPGSLVTMAAYAEGDWVCVSVEDQGRGIPPNEVDSIFETFYQINRREHEDQGAGSGLPIVKHITELHGGSVEVTSKLDVGSRFVIRLPTAKA